MILVIDNYDSFTYNLVQMISDLGEKVIVLRNDSIDVKGIRLLSPSAIVISPGPGGPESAGVSIEAIKELGALVPILGVCLGHQAIGSAFGARISQAQSIMHGKTSLIYHDGETIFRNVKNPFKATRYHSLVIERDSLPECLSISAYTEDGEIMGIRHIYFPIEGIQFHPESILTDSGSEIIKNFLNMVKQGDVHEFNYSEDTFRKTKRN